MKSEMKMNDVLDDVTEDHGDDGVINLQTKLSYWMSLTWFIKCLGS